jgi:hypothetical protein
MILWLDDLREPPSNDYEWAKTYEEAIASLNKNITFSSLDHDLGLDKSGYDVVCYMEENDIWPKDGVHVHSMNPVGKDRMNAAIYRHYHRLF